MIDLTAIGVLLLFVVLGWRRGLIRTLAELLVVVLALVLSAQFARSAAPRVVDTILRPVAYEALEARIEELDIGNASFEAIQEEAGRLVEAIPSSFVREQALRLLEEEHIVLSYSYTKTAVLELSRQAVDMALDGVVQDVVQSALCTVCFLILTFLLRIVVRALRIVEKLPGVRQLNELGGALVGLGKGLIVVGLALWVLRHTSVLTSEMTAGSVLFDLASRWGGGLIR